jgi:hypothetical protein
MQLQRYSKQRAAVQSQPGGLVLRVVGIERGEESVWVPASGVSPSRTPTLSVSEWLTWLWTDSWDLSQCLQPRKHCLTLGPAQCTAFFPPTPRIDMAAAEARYKCLTAIIERTIIRPDQLPFSSLYMDIQDDNRHHHIQSPCSSHRHDRVERRKLRVCYSRVMSCSKAVWA